MNYSLSPDSALYAPANMQAKLRVCFIDENSGERDRERERERGKERVVVGKERKWEKERGLAYDRKGGGGKGGGEKMGKERGLACRRKGVSM